MPQPAVVSRHVAIVHLRWPCFAQIASQDTDKDGKVSLPELAARLEHVHTAQCVPPCPQLPAALSQCRASVSQDNSQVLVGQVFAASMAPVLASLFEPDFGPLV